MIEGMERPEWYWQASQIIKSEVHSWGEWGPQCPDPPAFQDLTQARVLVAKVVNDRKNHVCLGECQCHPWPSMPPMMKSTGCVTDPYRPTPDSIVFYINNVPTVYLQHTSLIKSARTGKCCDSVLFTISISLILSLLYKNIYQKL